jgi:hypothetical protein
MLVEFIIRGGPENDFDLSANQWAEALRPMDASAVQLPGFGQNNIDIEVDGVRISFSPEPPGWQVSLRNPPSREWADRIVQSICKQMTLISGHLGEVVPI